MRRFILVFAGMVLTASASNGLASGKIVVNHDDWTLSNTGFTTSEGINDPSVFAVNVANYFTGGRPGSFLAYSNNFGLAQNMLSAAMTGAGHTWTVSMTQPFTVATLSNYDGVFIGGNILSSQALIDYVNSGGNVYIFGGAGGGFEPNTFNPFLNTFGLGFNAPYNGVNGSLAISSSHPLFAGVDHLYHNSGSSITDVAPADLRNQVILSATTGQGLIAVYDGSACGPPDGDMNVDVATDGRDIQSFTLACVAGSTVAADLCHGDFNGSGVIDAGDVAGFIAKTMAP